MTAAFITLFCWTISAIAASRAAAYLGGVRASRARLLLAFVLLAIPVLALERIIPLGPTAAWLMLSGAVGLGLGDLAFFLACERTGARLVVLIEQCAAVPLAAALEWWWLGGTLTLTQIAACALCVVGVGIALAPGSPLAQSRRDLVLGTIGALIAALGLAVSGVITRQAVAIAGGDGVDLSGPAGGLSAALWRILGGAILVIGGTALWPWLRWGFRYRTVRIARAAANAPPDWKRGWPWLLAAALGGPMIGVACYQWALVGEKAGPVLAVLALVPVAVMPVAWLVEGDRPHPLSWVGAAVAVAGAILIAMVP